MSPLVLFALKAAIGAGVAGIVGRLVAAHLPPIHIHTGHQRLDDAINILGNAALSVIKTELNGPLLEQVIEAAVSGQHMAGPLAAELPRLRQLALDAIGPAVQETLAECLGGQDAVIRRAETELLAAARDHGVATATAKQIVTLASGSKLVMPA